MEGARAAAKVGLASGDDDDSESDVVGTVSDQVDNMRSAGESAVVSARGQLAGMGTASYLLQHHLDDTWGTGVVPDFMRSGLVAVVAGVIIACILWSMVSFVDWHALATVLSSADQAETVSWLAGVPILIVCIIVTAHLWGCYNLALGLLAVIGALVALYMMDVNRQVAAHENYAAACDISPRVSCTAALKAPSASLVLGMPNAQIGLVFYLAILALTVLEAFTHVYFPVYIVFVLCFCAAIASIYLLQFSLVVLQIVCPVCMGAHLVNFSLLWIAWGYSEQVRWDL